MCGTWFACLESHTGDSGRDGTHTAGDKGAAATEEGRLPARQRVGFSLSSVLVFVTSQAHTSERKKQHLRAWWWLACPPSPFLPPRAHTDLHGSGCRKRHAKESCLHTANATAWPRGPSSLRAGPFGGGGGHAVACRPTTARSATECLNTPSTASRSRVCLSCPDNSQAVP